MTTLALIKLTTSFGGPEDMVLDTLNQPSRILVSVASRRPDTPTYGEIETVDPSTGAVKVMARTGEPAGLKFRPHGISLVRSAELGLLYVISHDDEAGEHPVIKYMIDGDTLVFVEKITSPHLVSPNALQAYPDGSFFICNDAGTRNSMKEKIFRMKKGNVLHYDGRGNWTVAAKNLGMPAGLTGSGDRVFVSAALENRFYRFKVDGEKLTDKEVLCKIKGPDNIRPDGTRLIVASHPDPLRFIAHVRDRTKRSPSMIVSVDAKTGDKVVLFRDNGKTISTASVAVRSGKFLMIGQIFEPFILCASGE